MSEAVQRHHVLEPFLARVERRTQADYGVVMEVLPSRGYLNLRGDPNGSGFLEAVLEVLGQPLPIAANTFTAGESRVFWLGPDEWLVMTEPGVEKALAARLEAALAGWPCALTDLTGGQICIRLGGRNARDVLAKGSTLDFHPRVFLPGQCAQTVLGKASVLIALSRAGADSAVSDDTRAGDEAVLADESGVFDIVVRRTFADYAAEWLYRSALEYGATVTVQSVGPM
ncbi:MAG: sarcosine oxidase subunit gamma [Gammaproteobacteria bacterium]|nr:sarcosine oxidase subunit gamma [Gammaproteobacteria bacterium]